MSTGIRLSLAAGALALIVGVAAPLAARDGQGPQGPPPGGGPPFGGLGRGGPRGPGGPMGRLGDLGPALRHAQVTEDQQQQIKSVMDSHRDEFRALGERMKTARDGMRAVVEADTIDENGIRAKAADVAAVEADLAVLGAKVRAEVLSLLTTEQIDRIKQFRAEMEKRRAETPQRRRGQ